MAERLAESGLSTTTSARGRALARYEILATPPEAVFDDVARRAAEVLKGAYGAISFFDDAADDAGEWFKSAVGLPGKRFIRAESFFLPFAAGALGADGGSMEARSSARYCIINDTLSDKRTRDHAWVANAPHICFYAGVLILSRERMPIGVLAVFDMFGREIKAIDLEVLVNLADLITARLEARAEVRRERRERQRPDSGSYPTGLTKPQMEPQIAAADEHVTNLAREFAQLEELLEAEIATRQSTEVQLREEKEFSDAVIASLPGAFFMFDKHGKMVRWNQSFRQHTGYAEDEIGALRAVEFIAHHDRALVADAIRRILERAEEMTLEVDLITRDGGDAPYVLTGRRLEIGGERYCIGVGRDISERRRTEGEIRDAKERLDLALEGSSLALWDWDVSTNEVFFSDGWAEMLGITPDGTGGAILRGEQVVGLNHVEDQPRFEAAMSNALRGTSDEFTCDYRVPDIDGNWIWLHSSGKVTERDASGRVRRMTGTIANITARKAAEERVEFLATRDPLTGLPNRMLLNDRLALGLANAARKKTRLAFMFIDLDRFKTINDSLGHDVGDELLKRVASRLSACVRASDTVARLGGDEFAIILENLPPDGQEVQSIAEKMISSLAAPIQVGEHQLNTSCSLGIAVFPDDGGDAQTIMKHADVAMYDAKAKGRNNYQFFSQAMNAKAQERLAVENLLRLAQRKNELLLYYQPRVGFKTGEVTGVEALLRWNHPQLGLVAPHHFLSVAEDSGLIVPIGEWVFEEAFRQVAEWQQKSERSLAVAVNLSGAQLVDAKRLMAAIEGALKKSGLDPHDVELELTESMLLKNSDEAAAVLQRLGELGVGIAVDNFGTGVSSLSYLRQLPIDSIKVDSSFVRDIGTDPNDEAIIRAIIAMTHSLKLNVVAEGVEREEQYRVLRDLECDEYQGFYFSKPLPPEEFEAAFL
ncbi:MAG: EAL domain-containing protein [Aeromicrobium sp.]|nr:EAL domain-containing protein [Burkholderiales bacterium]